LELFENIVDPKKNLLPNGGEVNYYGKVFDLIKANHYLGRLLDHIEWRHDQAKIYGKLIITKRKVAWYGDQSFDYTYSNTTKQALKWTDELLELKETVEQLSNDTYNSCLLNLYHNGNEAMAWHSDGEKDLKKNGAIASLSFGAERNFGFKHKTTKEKVTIMLEHGSLLVMKGTTQSYWMHSLSRSKKIIKPRINLTFRTIEKNK